MSWLYVFDCWPQSDIYLGKIKISTLVFGPGHSIIYVKERNRKEGVSCRLSLEGR